jgi:integrase
VKPKRIEPGIARHADGTWEVWAHVEGLPQYHKRHPPSLKRGDVRAIRDEELRRLRKMKAEPAMRGTLAADAETYLGMATVKAMPTYKERARHIRAWSAALGHRLRHSITTADVDAQLEHWQAVGIDAGKPRPLAGPTINRIRTALGHLYSKLDIGKALPNPVYGTKKRPEARATARGVGFDVPRELIAYMPDRGRAAKGRKRPPVSLSKLRLSVIVWTGLRHEELMRVRPADWNRETGALFVHAAKASQQRTIPLLDQASTALEALAAAGGLWNERGEPRRWSPSSARKAWLGAWRSANAARALCTCRHNRPPLAWCRPYDLRHTFLTELLKATRDLDTVREWAGHADASMTRRYTLAGVAVNVAAGAAALRAALPSPLPPSVAVSVNDSARKT